MRRVLTPRDVNRKAFPLVLGDDYRRAVDELVPLAEAGGDERFFLKKANADGSEEREPIAKLPRKKRYPPREYQTGISTKVLKTAFDRLGLAGTLSAEGDYASK